MTGSRSSDRGRSNARSSAPPRNAASRGRSATRGMYGKAMTLPSSRRAPSLRCRFSGEPAISRVCGGCSVQAQADASRACEGGLCGSGPGNLSRTWPQLHHPGSRVSYRQTRPSMTRSSRYFQLEIRPPRGIGHLRDRAKSGVNQSNLFVRPPIRSSRHRYTVRAHDDFISFDKRDGKCVIVVMYK